MMLHRSRPAWSPRGTVAVLLAGIATLALAAPASRAEEPTDRAAEPVVESVSVSPMAGVVAAIDPQTGKLREPSSGELQALRSAFALHFKRPSAAMQLKEDASGMLSMVVGGTEMSFSVARLGEQGEVVQACFDNPDDAARFLAVPVVEDR